MTDDQMLSWMLNDYPNEARDADAGPMFARLIALNREAFDAGHYNTAYHLLTAALHEAEDIAQRFAMVARLAEEQLAGIDAAHPAYEHSTRSAAARERTSIFVLLAQQARARLRMSGL
jgi:hypothetical protein